MDRKLESPTATVPRISGVSLSVPLSIFCATKKFLSKCFWIWRMSAREFAFPRLNLVAERKFNPKLFTFFKIIYIFEHYLLRTHTILFNGPDAQIWPERSYNQTSWLQIGSKPDICTTIRRLKGMDLKCMRFIMRITDFFVISILMKKPFRCVSKV